MDKRTAVFPLGSDGDVTITFPQAMTASSLEALKEYLDVWLSSVSRWGIAECPETVEPTTPPERAKEE